MERPSTTDRRVLAAARSLYHGRARQEHLAQRIDTAEATLVSWLLASGVTQALLGLYELDLSDGQLVVTKREVPDTDQLTLPYLEMPPPSTRSAPAPRVRIADRDVVPRQIERLSGLSEPELATLARAVLASLSAAEVAPLLARHEAGMVIDKPRRVFELLAPDMGALAHEQLRTLTLSTRHGLLGNHLVYQGTANEAPVRTAEVFRPAVVQQATAVIVAHNHPSGDPTPSADDHQLTRLLAEAGGLLGIRLIDHIVIAASGFYSFRESGQMPASTTDRNTISDHTTSPTIDLYGQERP